MAAAGDHRFPGRTEILAVDRVFDAVLVAIGPVAPHSEADIAATETAIAVAMDVMAQSTAA
ncbi:MAG: hypothetical protein DI537_18230 [Stutzerimonas stutzeri]|nr:MAG: hypothetical protein DI537_18230 [Stutzerimonas stutzeri]